MNKNSKYLPHPGSSVVLLARERSHNLDKSTLKYGRGHVHDFR